MTSRSRYVKHWFDIKVLSARILLKMAWELTHRYFIFVFSWGSVLSFRYFLGDRFYLFDSILETIPIGSWHCCNCTMKFRKGLRWDLSNSTSQSRSNVMIPTKISFKINYFFFFVAVAGSSDVFLKYLLTSNRLSKEQKAKRAVKTKRKINK